MYRAGVRREPKEWGGAVNFVVRGKASVGVYPLNVEECLPESKKFG